MVFTVTDVVRCLLGMRDDRRLFPVATTLHVSASCRRQAACRLYDASGLEDRCLSCAVRVTGGRVNLETRRPASDDRTARRQFQATGQPVSRTQASVAMTSRLPRYEAKCVQRRCFQCGSVPLRSDIKGTELPPANILIPLERQLIAL